MGAEVRSTSLQVYPTADLPHCRPTPLQSEIEKCHMGLQVKSTRKGLTNQLKTLLWRKPSTGGSAVSIHGRESPCQAPHMEGPCTAALSMGA